MNRFTAREALTERVQRVFEDERPPQPFDGANGTPVYAVFARAPDSPAPREGRFLGLVADRDILRRPTRIFGDLLPRPPVAPVRPDAPLPDILAPLGTAQRPALPVVDEAGNFVGAITHASLLAALLGRAGRGGVLQRDIERDHLALAVRAERLADLHDASLRLLGLLTVHGVEEELLQKGIESLTTLIGARYGAIGVLDEAGKLKQFVYTGIAPDEAARIGRLPESKGLLGVVIHENHALRLDDMTRDPRAVGFPPNHPPMKSLLAVPVSYAGQVFGRVYLSEKNTGEPFTDEDEQLVTRFADALALALRFHRAETERRRAQDVLQQVAHTVSAVTGETFFRTLVLDLAKALNVDYALVGELAPEREDTVKTVAVCAKGRLADNFTYELKGTPCANIVGKTACQYPDHVQEQFPEDPLLREMGIESYAGCPVFDTAGQPLGLVVVMDGKPMRDSGTIRALLQICAARAAAELERLHTDMKIRQLASAVEQTADAVLITDAEGVIQYVNRAYEQITGYTRTEAVGRKPNLVKSDHHDAAFYQRLWSTIRCGEPFRDIFINRRKDGSPYFEEKTITPLKNERGEVTHFVSTGKDVTERMRADETLREQEERFRQLAENIHQVFWMTSVDKNHMLYVSPTYEEIWGRPCQSLYDNPRSWLDAIPPDDRKRVLQAALTKQAAGTYRVEYRILRPDGTERWILDRAFPIRRETGEVYRIAGIAEDITEHKRAEAELRRSVASLRTAQRIAHLGNWDWDLNSGALTWSAELFHIFGLEPKTAVPTAEGFLQAVHPDDRARVTEAARGAIEDNEPFSLDFRILRPDGTVRVVHEEAEVQHDAAGRPAHMLGTTQDITERRQAEDMLARLGRILDDSSNEIYVFDADTLRFLQVNQAALNNLGYSLDEMPALTPLDVHPQVDRTSCMTSLELLNSGKQDSVTFETVNRRKDGSNYPVEVQLQLMRHETPPVFVAIIQDITERRQAEERLSFLAYHDTLTGLPNRVLLLERLRQSMLDADRVERIVAVLFLDLDRFKYINDTLGHHVGDALLKAVAERLQACVRPGDTIARLSGDEFTVVLANVAHVDDVARVARKILDSFAQPFGVDDRELFTTTSIGITLFPFDVRDAEGLLKNADAAMYHAKEQGRNTFQFFTAELNARAERRLKLETALRAALERNELVLHYQPQVDTKTGRILGMEALVRWTHPVLGNVSPVEFIPVAEEIGLILPIGEWVLREACRQIKVWHKTGFPKLQVAVNISGKQLRQKDFPDLVRQVLEETMLEAHYLDLELTESLLMEDVEGTADAMHMLHDLGVLFSVDDFGTGYSSLAYLKRFPIDILKIDRTFVRDIATDPNDVAIVRTIIAMAHTLGMRVVAEGVETRDQLEFLRAQGCDGSQGYYCSIPLPAEEFSELLADWGRIRQGRCRVGMVQRRTRKKPRTVARRRVRK